MVGDKQLFARVADKLFYLIKVEVIDILIAEDDLSLFLQQAHA
jgi:hypothetical protein